jgi:hypothetical protein
MLLTNTTDAVVALMDAAKEDDADTSSPATWAFAAAADAELAFTIPATVRV